jgi:hypothetical protein
MIKSLYTVLKRFSNLRQDPVSISQCGYPPTRRFLRGDAERHCVSFDLLIVVAAADVAKLADDILL